VSCGITVGEVGERELIARIRARIGPASDRVRLGIGDDAALLVPPKRALEAVTTDVLVEGVHFDRALTGAYDIGAKAVAVNLSDLAAMGATPRAVLLSLGLPPALSTGDFDALVAGVMEMAGRYGVALVGGNVTRSPGALFVDVTALGDVHPRKALTRAGGRPGDALYVTGCAGAAAAGLVCLRQAVSSGGSSPETDGAVADAIARYRRPDPRVRLGILVGRNRAASACIDSSDGLADAVRQIACASGTGARIDASAVPWHPAVARLWPSGIEAVEGALSGSDDYELLFAVPPRKRRLFASVAVRPGGPPVTRIGMLTEGRDIVIRRDDRDAALPAGYTHFG
jgi:thiamine-monophosphate kinase